MLLGCRVQGVGCEVQDVGCRAWGCLALGADAGAENDHVCVQPPPFLAQKVQAG